MAADVPGRAELEDLVRANGAIWFTANDGIHGRELWRYVP
jgi:hypothetical protein